jgi:hypothetical protein
VVELAGVANKAGGDVGEARHHEARAHGEGLEVRGEAAQAVYDGIGLEGAIVIRQSDKGLSVETQRELLVESARELRVEKGATS